MSNITYVKTPTFVVNPNGRVSDSVRSDSTKGQTNLMCQTKNFASLKDAINWINKEGQKKSSILYLYEIRPSVHGAYNVRSATYSPKKVVTKKTTSTNANTNSNANNNRNANSKSNANRNANSNTNSNVNNNRNANRNNNTIATNNNSNANKTVATKRPVVKAKAVAKPNTNGNANRNTRSKAIAKMPVNSMTKKS